jgi:hypothetical protein
MICNLHLGLLGRRGSNTCLTMFGAMKFSRAISCVSTETVSEVSETGHGYREINGKLVNAYTIKNRKTGRK